MSENPSVSNHGGDQPSRYQNPYGDQADSSNTHNLVQGAEGDLVPINPLYNVPQVVRAHDVDIFQSILYGFKATIVRPGLWIGGHVLVFVGVFLTIIVTAFASGVLSEINEPLSTILLAFVVFAICIAWFLALPIVDMLALGQIDGQRMSISEARKAVHWGPALATLLLVAGISVIVLLVLALCVGLIAFVVFEASGSTSSAPFIVFFLAYLLMFVVLFANQMLLATATKYAVEGRYGPWQSIKAGVADVCRNFWSFVGLWLLWTLIASAVGTVTLGLSTLITTPAFYHCLAFAYRQSSRAPYPNI